MVSLIKIVFLEETYFKFYLCAFSFLFPPYLEKSRNGFSIQTEMAELTSWRYDSLFVANKNGITDCFVALPYSRSFVQSIHKIIIYTQYDRIYFLCFLNLNLIKYKLLININ